MTIWLEATFLRVLNMSVTAGICIAVILLIRLIFRKIPRRYLYIFWLAAAFRLICPFSVSGSFSLFNLAPFSREGVWMTENSIIAFEESMAADISAAERNRAHAPAAETNISNTNRSISPVMTKQEQPDDTGVIFLASQIWAVGMMVCLLYFLLSWIRILFRVRMAVRTEDNVYECDEIVSPFVFGILRPRIYVPCGMTMVQREMVVLHEKYHLHRKDHLIKLFSFALLGVYWFHPLVWIGWAAMCKDMEMSCDEHVLGQLDPERRPDYSRTLLALGTEPKAAAKLPLAFGENDVKRRVRHALTFQKPAFRMKIAAALLLLAVLIFLGTDKAKQPEVPEEVQEEAQEEAQDEALPLETLNPSSTEAFLEWYAGLPMELYAEAYLYETGPRDSELTHMYVLAQTEDQMVTVYGLYTPEYGARGITVDWKTTSGGDSSHTYFDWWWNVNHGHYEAYQSDYDGDGRDEIALTVNLGSGTGVLVEGLYILETDDIGNLEPFAFTPRRQQEEWERQIDWTLDGVNQLVQVIRKDSPSSVPVLSLPYGSWIDDAGAPTGICIGDQVRFEIGKEIHVYYAVGLHLTNSAIPWYQESGNDTLDFQVIYHGETAGNDAFELTGLQGIDRYGNS